MLLMLFSFLVHAQEAALVPSLVAGHFESQGQYEILSLQKTEEVQTATESGQSRLNELLKLGYSCSEISSTRTRCLRAFLPPLVEIHPKLDQVVKDQWGGQIFSFYDGVGTPELATNTDFFKQWMVPQKVVLWRVFQELEKHVWNPVFYTWTQGDWKVYLGNAFEADYFPMMILKNKLKLAQNIEIQNGTVRDRYFLHIHFQQVK